MFNEIMRFCREEDAASLVEYALVIAAGTLVATALKPTFQEIANSLNQNSGSEFDHFIEINTISSN